MSRLAQAMRIAALAVATGCASSPEGAPIRVIVPKGATFSAATDSLSNAGLVGSELVFKLYARVTGKDRNIKPGTYLIRRGTPWPDIVGALHGGRGLVNTVTIPEGFTLAQIADALSKALKVPVDSVMTAARDTALLRRLNVPTPTLEGYLFPDTYAFPEGTRAQLAVAEMVSRFEREWTPEWTALLGRGSRTRHEVITLASIVEREARIAKERPVIAGVYLNRLRINMPLQADPTVQYARGQHTARVMYKDLEIDSPYNTYKYPGLPPGPIASPGGASIEAALSPATVPYLYFVAAPDGSHNFSRNFDEHTAKVQAARAAARRSGQ